MLICPPNEVLNRLTFEERMAKEPPTTVVDMELSPEDRQRIYMEEKNQLSDRGTLEIRFIMGRIDFNSSSCCIGIKDSRGC